MALMTRNPRHQTPRPNRPDAAEDGTGRSVATVTELHRSFGTTHVLRGLDLEIRGGEFVALLGRSGSGKSTLLRSLAGLDPASPRELTVHGAVSVAFQEPRLLPWRTVEDNVALALANGPLRRIRREHAAGPSTRSASPRSATPGRSRCREARPSGCRWPAPSCSKPNLLLLDEPFSALDALTRIEMHRLVVALWKRHRPGVLLVTHDVDEALALADRVLVLDQGRSPPSGRSPCPVAGGTATRRSRHQDPRPRGPGRRRRHPATPAPNDLPKVEQHENRTPHPPSGRPRRRGLALTALSACASASGQNADAVRDDGTVDLSKVTLTVGDQKGGSKALLQASGALDDLPYDVEWKEFTSGPPLLEALNAGAIDIGGVGNTPPLFAAAASSDLVVVAGDTMGAKGDAIVVPRAPTSRTSPTSRARTSRSPRAARPTTTCSPSSPRPASGSTRSRCSTSSRPTRWPRSAPGTSTPGRSGTRTPPRPSSRRAPASWSTAAAW